MAAWHQLMKAFNMARNDDMYHQLISCYDEKHRAYHTLDHIEACFRHFEAVRQDVQYPHEIKLALWFHDVIYKPFSASNEEDSAALAKSFLSKNGVAPDIIARVYDLIILTKDHAAPQTQDAKLMLDIDLSILGAAPHIYAQFEKDVQKEYRLVPAFIFKSKRKDILQSFIDRSPLYHTAYFSERLGPQARQNLKWAISNI